MKEHIREILNERDSQYGDYSFIANECLDFNSLIKHKNKPQ